MVGDAVGFWNRSVSEPGVLMCQPCDTSSARSGGQPRFLPLTDLDRERLRTFLEGTRP